jgi:hypothetical protein
MPEKLRAGMPGGHAQLCNPRATACAFVGRDRRRHTAAMTASCDGIAPWTRAFYLLSAPPNAHSQRVGGKNMPVSLTAALQLLPDRARASLPYRRWRANESAS